MLKLTSKANIVRITRTTNIRYFISDKFMKERDEAAEKVFISRQESKHLLNT